MVIVFVMLTLLVSNTGMNDLRVFASTVFIGLYEDGPANYVS